MSKNSTSTRLFYQTIHVVKEHSLLWFLRAFTSVRLNFLSILHETTYLFYFTRSLLQKTYISLSILHIYLIKYSIYLHFLLFPFLSSPLSRTLSQTQHKPQITHTQPPATVFSVELQPLQMGQREKSLWGQVEEVQTKTKQMFVECLWEG